MRYSILVICWLGLSMLPGFAATTGISSGGTALTLKTQGSAPATPPSGYLTLYADTASGLLKTKDSSGTIAGIGGSGLDTTAILALTNTTDSSSASTGAIQTLGGIGVAKSVYIGTSGSLHVLALTDSSSASTGSVQLAGGMGVAKMIHVGTSGGIHVLATTAASAVVSPSGSLVGSIITEGGMTVLKDSWFNGIRIGRGAGDISSNTALGVLALAANTTGSNNTAFGASSLRLVTTGGSNTAIGSGALFATTTNSSNTAVGRSALAAVTTSDNTAVGSLAFQSLSTGQRSIAIGAEAGRLNSDSSVLDDALNSIYIGTFTQGLVGGNENAIVIGYAAISEGSNTTVLGNSSTTTTHIYGATKLGGGLVRSINGQTASYMLVATDASAIVTMTVGSANTLTIPTNASVPFPLSMVIDVVQLGAGLTSVAGDTGVTVHGNLNSAGQYMGLSLMKIGTDEWVVIGGVP